MSVLSCAARKFLGALAWLLSVSRTGNASSVWELPHLSNRRPHCVPIALVAIVVCVVWLQDTPQLQAASVNIAMTEFSVINDDASDMLALSVLASPGAVANDEMFSQ